MSAPEGQTKTAGPSKAHRSKSVSKKGHDRKHTSSRPAAKQAGSEKVPPKEPQKQPNTTTGRSKPSQIAFERPQVSPISNERMPSKPSQPRPSGKSTPSKRSQTTRGRQFDTSRRRPTEGSPGSKRQPPAGQFTSKATAGAAMDHPHDEFSSRERQQIGESFRKKMTVAACVVGIVLLVTASVLAYWFLFPGRNAGTLGHISGADILRRLESACDTEDCKSSLALINASVDHSADPCADMYQLACGRWHAENENGENMTYDESVIQKYVSAMHSSLLGGSGDATAASSLCRSSQAVAKIGCVYASCLAFFTNRTSTLSELWTAAGIDSTGWMAARDFGSLFVLVVRTALTSHLPSAFRIIKKNDTTAQVDTGTCIACGSNEASFPKFVLDLLAKSLGAGRVQPLSSSFLELDSALKQLIYTSSSRGSPRSVRPGELDMPKQGLSWSRALAQSDVFGRGQGEIQLVSANLEATKRLMSKLFDVKLEVIKLYFLVVPVAPFMALEHYAAQQRSREASGPRTLCLEDVHRMFGVSFDDFSGTALETSKASVSFRKMWTDIRLKAAKTLHIAKGLELDQKALMEATFREHGGMDVVDEEILSVEYGESFLANLILYQGRTQSQLNLTEFQRGAKPESDDIPRSHFLPDYFYSGATETAVNYGTLGVLTASMLFDKSFPKGHKKPSEYIECFDKYARDTLHLSLDKGAWLRYTQARWSADASFEALEGEDYMHGLDELFYLRFARTYCGESESTIMVLRYALLASKHFASAFGCTQPVVMQC